MCKVVKEVFGGKSIPVELYKTLRACLVLFLNLYFLRIKMKMKMVFYSCCISNLNMRLVLFSVSCILKLKTVICVR